MAWNFGDILDTIAPVLPGDKPALIHIAKDGTAQIKSWAEFDARSNNLARQLIERGAKPGDKVAFYMRNRSEYAELLAACFKARLTHVNVNYRYQPDELHYIFDNSDAQTIVYGEEFADNIAELKPRLGKVGTFLEVTAGTPANDFADRYEDLTQIGNGGALGIERSGDDQLFLYTGGTTGMPKGVMWPADDLREAQLYALRALGEVPETLEQLSAAIKETGTGAGPFIPACPMMHGTGLFTAIGNMMNGGCIVTLDNENLDPHAIWKAVNDYKVEQIAIVGDTFAKPMLKALEDEPGKYDLSSLVSIISSGVMWSLEVKRDMIPHMPQAMLMDSFGSSEGIGFGSSIFTADGEVKTAKFQIGERCKVFDEDDQEVQPGSGKSGVIAVAQPIPLGYYKDEEKTAKTFRTINGMRYSIPGDFCTVEEDGTLTLLGRGSVCINTGGEKVYPEEVEEALKTHPAVEDALVVGLPDEKWGQAITGVITMAAGEAADEAALIAHVKDNLAHYKAPKRVLVAADAFRAPNGKADYKGATSFAKQELGIAS